MHYFHRFLNDQRFLSDFHHHIQIEIRTRHDICILSLARALMISYRAASYQRQKAEQYDFVYRGTSHQTVNIWFGLTHSVSLLCIPTLNQPFHSNKWKSEPNASLLCGPTRNKCFSLMQCPLQFAFSARSAACNEYYISNHYALGMFYLLGYR